MPAEIIIADTSCLIGLTNVNLLEILQRLYSKVTITPEVAKEYGLPLPEWIGVESLRNRQIFNILFKTLDLGEASAIALAYESKNPVLILDDRDAREVAQESGFKVIGTIGVLKAAFETGLIADYKPVIAKLRENKFRMPKDIEKYFEK
jgi:predicted nucleic acid-binding protein